jgi:hypothetical protein
MSESNSFKYRELCQRRSNQINAASTAGNRVAFFLTERMDIYYQTEDAGWE